MQKSKDLVGWSCNVRSLHFPLSSVEALSTYSGENTTRGLVMLQAIKVIFSVLICLILVGCFCLGFFGWFLFFPYFNFFFFKVNLTQANNCNA